MHTSRTSTGFVLACLMLASPVASAEWTKVGQNSEMTVFYDAKSIQRVGTKSRMWVLTNFSKPLEIQGRQHQSSKTRFEYDCTDEKSRVDGTYFYALPDGRGEVTGGDPGVNTWFAIAPKSMGARVMRIACQK